MTEGEALTISADTFQSLVNNQGLLLVEGQPSDSTLDHHRLLALTSRSGYVECFSKWVHFKYHATIAEVAPDSDSSRSDEDDEQTEEPLDKVVHELSDWRTSRPLVVHHLRGSMRFPVER